MSDEYARGMADADAATPLEDVLRRLALTQSPKEAKRLRDLADRLEEASASGNPKKFRGAWARARRAYCDLTGEDLV